MILVIEKVRISQHSKWADRNGKSVIYWMQSSQRIECNHALEYAIELANESSLPLIVLFNLYKDFPNASYRHYKFMMVGIKELESKLRGMGIAFAIRAGEPSKILSDVSEDALVVVTDVGYTRILKEWRKKVSETIECPLVTVESNVVVPVETASPKEEYSAATIRKKIMSMSPHFLHPLKTSLSKIRSLEFDMDNPKMEDVGKFLKGLGMEKEKQYIERFKGGTDNCLEHLENFVTNKARSYDALRNDPTKDMLSNMGPYLHFGQVSPITIALKMLKEAPQYADPYLEELIVRRELAVNFVHYNKNYDELSSIPTWARETLDVHSSDKREHIYSMKELEGAKTHDPFWNAAQREMVLTGKMHGYMRMYWGKKILEWTESPELAYRSAIYLNDRYELDGRDPNGYAGISWCFGKHDRAWKERGIFGKVRYMNDKGLKRKFDANKYVQMIENIDIKEKYINREIT